MLEPESQLGSLGWYSDPQMSNAPVVGVSWFECQKFAAWAGCRLPNEREWEYAARGVENLIYPWGNEFIADNLIYEENSDDRPWDVTSKPEGRSWVGAHHLSGNVWEWLASLYKDYPYVADGSREQDMGNIAGVRRVLRGGDLGLIGGVARVAYRGWGDPNTRRNLIGLRLLAAAFS